MPRKAKESPNLSYGGSALLKARWEEVVQKFDEAAPDSPDDPLGVGHPLMPLIRACLTSRSLSYHYVLPTQLLAKSVDPDVDARSLQARHGTPGAFDARSLAHEVIVPFDRDNNRVLGGSPEPYVNNPLRVAAVTADFRGQQKNAADWDKLAEILDVVQTTDDPEFTRRVFDQVLFEIYRMLSQVQVVYPAPNRISLEQTYGLIQQYLEERSGGDRTEAVCTALFRTIGQRFGLFDEVKRQRVNAADVPSGMAADIECWTDGTIVLLVEVKDRTLTLTQLEAKIDSARAKHISEVLFLAEQGKEPADEQDIDAEIKSEFTSGQNIYVSNFVDFSLGVLILFREDGRVQFLREIGMELDRAGSRIEHRRAWATLLRTA
jgi:hypothetical protein